MKVMENIYEDKSIEQVFIENFSNLFNTDDIEVIDFYKSVFKDIVEVYCKEQSKKSLSNAVMNMNRCLLSYDLIIKDETGYFDGISDDLINAVLCESNIEL